MIEGINLLISIFIGCIVFIYYTNALFKPRTKYLYANISIIVGYMMLYAISEFGSITGYVKLKLNNWLGLTLLSPNTSYKHFLLGL